MKSILRAFLLLLFVSPTNSQHIKTVSDSMVAGEWKPLVAVIDGPLHDGASVTGEHLTYAMSGQWNSEAKEEYYIGAGHGVNSAPWVFKYVAATNTWKKLAALSPPLVPSHNYGHTALNTYQRRLYTRDYNGQKIYGWNVISDTFLGLLTTAPFDLGNVAEGVCWFEDLNGAGNEEGGLLIYDGEQPSGTEAHIWEPSKGTGPSAWTKVNNVIVPGPTSGNYHTWAAYSKAYNVAFVGGGNNQQRKVAVINANRTVTAVPDAPVNIRVQGANAVVDPVTGKLIVYGFGQLWELGPSGSSWVWNRLTDPPGAVTADSGIGNPGSPNFRSIFSTPIPDYGVIKYSRTTNQSQPGVFYLYKHAVSGPPPPNTPPEVAITSPATGAAFIAGSTIVFTVNASDNGSVSKVDFFANSNFIGSNSVAPFGFLWATVGAGSYAVTAKATDNLGLETTSQTVVLTVCNCQ